MIIDKNSKWFYKLATKLYDIMNNADDSAFIYFTLQDGLVYSAGTVSGIMRIAKENVNQMDELKNGSFYELSKLPRKRFELKERRADEDLENAAIVIIKRFQKTDFVCELKAEEYYVISRLTRLTNMCLNDFYASKIKAFKGCNVYIKPPYLIIKKQETDELIEISEQMSFVCTPFEEIDIQQKLDFQA